MNYRQEWAAKGRHYGHHGGGGTGNGTVMPDPIKEPLLTFTGPTGEAYEMLVLRRGGSASIFIWR